jgi:hypothetical protein
VTQTRHAGRPYPGACPFPLNAAREAYVRSDYAQVLDLLGGVRIGEPAPIEAWLLRARALLRLHRADDVAVELAPVLPTITDTDERTTAAMLHGAALARLVPARGIAVLAAIADTAQRERAHAAVRAEISYYRAVAHWSADELDRAEELARDAQRNGRDVLAVRAMQLRAWIAAARPSPTRFSDALTIWHNASRAYARCHERDLDLAATIAYQTASLEQTLRSSEIRGTHRSARGSRNAPGSAFPARTPSSVYVMLVLRRRVALRARRRCRDRAREDPRSRGGLAHAGMAGLGSKRLGVDRGLLRRKRLRSRGGRRSDGVGSGNRLERCPGRAPRASASFGNVRIPRGLGGGQRCAAPVRRNDSSHGRDAHAPPSGSRSALRRLVRSCFGPRAAR